MLSMTIPAVTTAEALEYTSSGGIAVELQGPDLIRGQRYIAARFNSRWRVAFDNDSAPDEVKYSIIEAAMVEQKAPGSLTPSSTPGTDKVLVQAGKLSWERVGDASAPDAYIPRISAVEGLLSGLVWPLRSGVFIRAIGR